MLILIMINFITELEKKTKIKNYNYYDFYHQLKKNDFSHRNCLKSS